MTSLFIKRAIERAGLGAVLELRRTGETAKILAVLSAAGAVDLLVLGALADAIRFAEAGDVVHVHPHPASSVTWIARGTRELDLLADVARARIVGPLHARIGVVWGPMPGWADGGGDTGMELAQVALGFGATDLTGPITRKSGALIAEDDLKKVKGKGMVQASALKRREIAALLRNAGRTCIFTDEPAGPTRAHDAEAINV